MRGEDFPVGEFDDSPAVVAVAVFGEFAVDGLLAEGDYAVYLLFGVREAGGYVEVVAADVDLEMGLEEDVWRGRESNLRRVRPCRRRCRRTGRRR